MDKHDSLKIIVADIDDGSNGIHIVFKIQLPQMSKEFRSVLLYNEVKKLDHLKILDMAWDQISQKVDDWLETKAVYLDLLKLKNTEYKPRKSYSFFNNKH
jgi:hypothetical protein